MRWALLAAAAVVVAVLAWPGSEPEPPPPAAKPVPRLKVAELLEAVHERGDRKIVGALRNILSAQAQFQAETYADANGNGVGEYGTLDALCAVPLLDTSFRPGAGGRARRSGYYFRVHLPAETLLRETVWCCYAWPADGEGHVYFVNHWGDVLYSDDAPYRGEDEPPAWAALAAKDVTADSALDAAAADGHRWRLAR